MEPEDLGSEVLLKWLTADATFFTTPKNQDFHHLGWRPSLKILTHAIKQNCFYELKNNGLVSFTSRLSAVCGIY